MFSQKLVLTQEMYQITRKVLFFYADILLQRISTCCVCWQACLSFIRKLKGIRAWFLELKQFMFLLFIYLFLLK